MSQNIGTETVKKGMSTGAKWAIGCAIAFVALVVLCAAIFVGGLFFIKHKADAAVKKYEGQGYQKVTGTQVVISEPVNTKTVYECQSIAIMNGSNTDIAIVSLVATIHGMVKGNVHFEGQAITVEKDAEITGSLDVTAQIVTVYGAVDGGVTGMRQMLNNQGRIGSAAPAAESNESAPTAPTPAAESTSPEQGT